MTTHSKGKAGYSGTPLPRKLGIREGSRVVLSGAPPGFEDTLGPLPAGASTVRRLSGRFDLVIWFPLRLSDLRRRLPDIAARIERGGLWIAWPKKSSGVATDLTQDDVRRLTLEEGLVDHKICAIDEVYSALRFARRR